MEFTDAALEPFGKTILDMKLPSQLSMKTPLVFRIVKELKEHGCLPWTGSPRAELCFDEAVTNAMVHGNRLDPSRKVRVIVCADEEKWGVIVDDEGEGFGPEDVPDPDDPEFILRESGRGILLMDGWVDGLRHNRTARRLMMVRKRQEEPEDIEATAAIEPEEEPEKKAEPVEYEEIAGVQVVRVNEERIGEDNIAPLRDAANAALAKGENILLDLKRVTYISSVGLSTLVSLYKSARARNGRLLLASVQPAVKEILESSHLTRLFTFVADVDKGVSELM
jgi:serine/threonine-protein kinase RsbW